MTGARSRKKEEVRDRVVDAATRLFEERGIDATSIDDIARDVGISRATVFNYFPYKEAILVEIGARFVAEIGQRAATHRRRSVRNALYDLADGVADIVERHAPVVPYIVREMTHPDAERRQYAADRMQYPLLYREMLRELAHAKRLRHPSREPSYERQLVDMTTGTLVRAGEDFPLPRLRAELRANVDLFVEGALLSAD